MTMAIVTPHYMRKGRYRAVWTATECNHDIHRMVFVANRMVNGYDTDLFGDGVIEHIDGHVDSAMVVDGVVGQDGFMDSIDEILEEITKHEIQVSSV